LGIGRTRLVPLPPHAPLRAHLLHLIREKASAPRGSSVALISMIQRANLIWRKAHPYHRTCMTLS